MPRPLLNFSKWGLGTMLTQFCIYTAKLYNYQYTSNAIPGLSSESVEASQLTCRLHATTAFMHQKVNLIHVEACACFSVHSGTLFPCMSVDSGDVYHSRDQVTCPSLVSVSKFESLISVNSWSVALYIATNSVSIAIEWWQSPPVTWYRSNSHDLF